MKKEILYLTIVVSALLTSCASTKIKTSTSKTMDIYGAGVIHKPVLVDLDVREQKVTGTAFASEGSSLETTKQEAVSNALKSAVADVLVEPTFNTETFNGRITATVTGFPANYKNFRSIKAEDVPLLQAGISQKAKIYGPEAVAKRKRSRFGIIAAVVLVVTAVALKTVL